MTIRFVHDELVLDPAAETFLLGEPPLLFGESPPRLRVHGWRAENGWLLLYSREFDQEPDQAGRDGGGRVLVDFCSQITGPASAAE